MPSAGSAGRHERATPGAPGASSAAARLAGLVSGLAILVCTTAVHYHVVIVVTLLLEGCMPQLRSLIEISA